MYLLVRHFVVFYCFSVLLLLLFISYSTRSVNTRRHFVQPASQSYLYPLNWTLVDLDRFTFLINNNVCQEDDVSLVILVTSHPGNVHLRRAARRTLPQALLRQFKFRRVFLLAQRNPLLQNGYREFSQEGIEMENDAYGDIIQGDFIESYRNLTYKHVMGLQWAVHYCPQAEFILKVDDDSAVDVLQFIEFLRRQVSEQQKPVIVGAVMKGPELKVYRNHSNKWSVELSEFQDEFYPPFVSGWAYATTVSTAALLVAKTKIIPYFWIDDVYVTGILAQKINSTLIDVRNKLTVNTEDIRCCLTEKYQGAWCKFWIGPSMGDDELLSSFWIKAVNCRMKSCATRQNSSDFCVVASNPSPLRVKGSIVKSEIVDLNIG